MVLVVMEVSVTVVVVMVVIVGLAIVMVAGAVAVVVEVNVVVVTVVVVTVVDVAVVTVVVVVLSWHPGQSMRTTGDDRPTILCSRNGLSMTHPPSSMSPHSFSSPSHQADPLLHLQQLSPALDNGIVIFSACCQQ